MTILLVASIALNGTNPYTTLQKPFKCSVYLQKFTIAVNTIMFQSSLLSIVHQYLQVSRILKYAQVLRKRPQIKMPRVILIPRGIFEIQLC